MKPLAFLAGTALLAPQPAAADICPATVGDAAAFVLTLTPVGNGGTNPAVFARGGPRILGRAPVRTEAYYAGDRIRQLRIAIPVAPTFDYAAGLTAGQRGSGLSACDAGGVCMWEPSRPAARGGLDSITVQGDGESKLAIVVCDYVI